MTAKHEYQSGFGNEFATEALPGALPVGRNSPQKVKYGLYAEQLTGSPFTMPRAQNRRSWLYRILPSVKHPAYAPYKQPLLRSTPFDDAVTSPNQMRWDPPALPKRAPSATFSSTDIVGK